MVTFFGILEPLLGKAHGSEEAPRKRSFFGDPVDPAAVPPAEADALYLSGKRPDPPEHRPAQTRADRVVD